MSVGHPARRAPDLESCLVIPLRISGAPALSTRTSPERPAPAGDGGEHSPLATRVNSVHVREPKLHRFRGGGGSRALKNASCAFVYGPGTRFQRAVPNSSREGPQNALFTCVDGPGMRFPSAV